jgi:hypothetical protein
MTWWNLVQDFCNELLSPYCVITRKVLSGSANLLTCSFHFGMGTERDSILHDKSGSRFDTGMLALVLWLIRAHN